MTCVPCPCDLLQIESSIVCNTISNTFQDPPRLGQLYTGIYTAGEYIPNLLNGIPEIAQNDLTSTIIQLALVLSLPWIILFLILLVVLAQSNAISIYIAIILFVLLVVVLLIAVIFIYSFVINVISDFSSQILTQLSTNWNDNKNTAVNDILSSYLNCDYCTSDTKGCDKNCGGTCSVCPVKF